MTIRIEGGLQKMETGSGCHIPTSEERPKTRLRSKAPLSPEEEEFRRVERETFTRDLKEHARYLVSVAAVYELRRKNPRWREIR